MISKAGAGSGTVTSSPTGINCGSTCKANYVSGTSVTLNAAAASGSTFGGWNNQGCTGTPATCTVIVTFNSATRSTAATTASTISPSLV
ncbi:MAG: hypothetical protein LM523_11385 [Candidatus Contendobacter sp.]|nr:hypothetical protein [Candidatus Contendobacter sp.]